jgi:hypothetical protein
MTGAASRKPMPELLKIVNEEKEDYMPREENVSRAPT